MLAKRALAEKHETKELQPDADADTDVVCFIHFNTDKKSKVQNASWAAESEDRVNQGRRTLQLHGKGKQKDTNLRVFT